MIKRTWKRPVATVVLLLGLAACEQRRGEACQVNRDCAEGLECIRGRGVEHATCEPIGSSVPEDGGGAADAAADASALDDGAADASALDDAAADASTLDDAAADAGAPDAGGDEDAGQ
jgi:hypothetical protein